MIRLTPEQAATLRDWFLPDQPGPLVGLHVLQTGHGACLADRWPSPRAVLAETAGNYALAGEPEALAPADLLRQISGFVEAPERFVPLLTEIFPGLAVWERVILQLDTRPALAPPSGCLVRRLGPRDRDPMRALSGDSSWISKTWGGPDGLAACGCAWGAWVDGRLASVACPFFIGERYEDIGVVTEPEFRGRGLSVACAGALCGDILDRGRRPSWSTSLDNTASLRVAEKLGFSVQRRDHLYVVGVSIPEPPGTVPG
jgi:RimJ/RimL family protein N-acetyltransferase